MKIKKMLYTGLRWSNNIGALWSGSSKRIGRRAVNLGLGKIAGNSIGKISKGLFK